jgi:hypothetical protein
VVVSHNPVLITTLGLARQLLGHPFDLTAIVGMIFVERLGYLDSLIAREYAI